MVLRGQVLHGRDLFVAVEQPHEVVCARCMVLTLVMGKQSVLEIFVKCQLALHRVEALTTLTPFSFLFRGCWNVHFSFPLLLVNSLAFLLSEHAGEVLGLLRLCLEGCLLLALGEAVVGRRLQRVEVELQLLHLLRHKVSLRRACLHHFVRFSLRLVHLPGSSTTGSECALLHRLVRRIEHFLGTLLLEGAEEAVGVSCLLEKG